MPRTVLQAVAVSASRLAVTAIAIFFAMFTLNPSALVRERRRPARVYVPVGCPTALRRRRPSACSRQAITMPAPITSGAPSHVV